ncbi:chaperone DnaJ-domain superfamily protein [Wolffia australiana]
MDYYQALGLRRGASKEEIKEAFRHCALKFHPDRHSLSPPAVQDQAALRFRQAAEAYHFLIDDRRRALYDLPSRSSSSAPFAYARSDPPRSPAFDWDLLFRYLTGRRFLLHLALASAILGGAVAIERSGDAIWKMNNSGKSFEEAMETIEKARRRREEG